MRINTGLTEFRVQLGQIDAALEQSAMWIIIAFVAGLVAGIILGATWPSTR